MTTASELRAGLMALAKRSVGIMAACANEESAKLHLVLPFVSLLGFDASNPLEVYPDHRVPSVKSDSPRADFAVLRQGQPIIAIECGPVGKSLDASAKRLRAYFDALPTVKVGIVTDGILFEFYVDAASPDAMDDEPFFTLDCETLAGQPAPDEIIEPLLSFTRMHFDPAIAAEAAHVQLVKKRLRTVFSEEARSPTEGLCRFALDRAGFKSIPRSAIERHYAPLVKAAFEESLVLPVVDTLRAASAPTAGGAEPGAGLVDRRIARSDCELKLTAYIRRRLAFLVDTEAQYAAIDEVRVRDYVGRLTFYVARERKGRLFDFIEGGNGEDKYIFPDPIGAIVTKDVRDIDDALRAVFEARVAELGSIAMASPRARASRAS